jgi:hypothetical protein
MPVLFAWGRPDDVTGANLLHGFAVLLRPADAGHDNEGLTQRVRVPGCSRAGLEGNAGTPHTGLVGPLKEKTDILTVPVNQSTGSFAGECEPLLLISMILPFLVRDETTVQWFRLAHRCPLSVFAFCNRQGVKCVPDFRRHKR